MSIRKIGTVIREKPIKLVQYLRREKERYEPVVISKCMIKRI